MIHNVVHNLCESLVTNIGDIADTGKRTPPTPITYLTQWKVEGNSEVHTDPFLTSWKVSGNSVVDNNAILSCGDLGQDGKYHVKISNDVDIYDIALDEPLRKVNDVADTIEFPSGTDGKALVTRNLVKIDLGNVTYTRVNTTVSGKYRWGVATGAKANSLNILNCKYTVVAASVTYHAEEDGVASDSSGNIRIYESEYNGPDDANNIKAANADVDLIYELETPTTELVDVSPFPVSSTDTYTSANETSYSAFEYKKNVEIWSCGEYNATDGKWHILVQPLGGSITDIALDEPLRKYNNAVDSIEYADSVAALTREVEEIDGQLDVLDTPTTKTIEVPQIAEAESYTCEISQGGKAVSWSSFETN